MASFGYYYRYLFVYIKEGDHFFFGTLIHTVCVTHMIMMRIRAAELNIMNDGVSAVFLHFCKINMEKMSVTIVTRVTADKAKHHKFAFGLEMMIIYYCFLELFSEII